MNEAAVQDHYPEDFAHCYGCGRLNAHGLHVRTIWDGDETIAQFTPRLELTDRPGGGGRRYVLAYIHLPNGRRFSMFYGRLALIADAIDFAPSAPGVKRAGPIPPPVAQ